MPTRVTIKISDDLNKKLSYWSNSFGMTKSGFIAYSLGYHIHELEYKNDIVDSVIEKVKSTDLSGGSFQNEYSV